MSSKVTVLVEGLMEQKHVVIVGGGFAGLAAAKRLANKPSVRVTLIDRRNHHLFQPLLYQVAICLLYTSPSPRDGLLSRMPSSA